MARLIGQFPLAAAILADDALVQLLLLEVSYPADVAARGGGPDPLCAGGHFRVGCCSHVRPILISKFRLYRVAITGPCFKSRS